MKRQTSLAFQITNDLLNAGVIVEDVKPTEVQELVQARLRLDRRFRDDSAIHLARPANFQYPGYPCCGQSGDTNCSENIADVTCLKCLAGYGNSIQFTGIEVAE